MDGITDDRQVPGRLARVLISPDDGRMRAGWRILIFLVLFMGLSIGGQVAIRAALGGFPRGSGLVFVLLATTATIAVLIARRYLDRKSFVSLGLGDFSRGWKDLLFGFVLSGVMAATVFGVLVGFGLTADVAISVSVGEALALLALPLGLTILIGYWEELVFRGYLLQNMAEGMGMPLAIAVSCIVYGLVHAANPSASVLSSTIIVLFGFLRIYGYLATGLLWLSIGMHIGWNFFQGPVFGFAASGHIEDQTVITQTPTGPEWLSGGDFGPEASVVTVPIVVLAIVAMRLWSRRYAATR